jgi:hypothetical protein
MCSLNDRGRALLRAEVERLRADAAVGRAVLRQRTTTSGRRRRRPARRTAQSAVTSDGLTNPNTIPSNEINTVAPLRRRDGASAVWDIVVPPLPHFASTGPLPAERHHQLSRRRSTWRKGNSRAPRSGNRDRGERHRLDPLRPSGD